MAILPTVPGLTVTIHSPSPSPEEHEDSPTPFSPLPEYTNPSDPSIPAHLLHKVTTSYISIPSTPSTTFSIQIQLSPPYKHDCPSLEFCFVINGNESGLPRLCSHEDVDEETGKWEYMASGWEVVDEEGRGRWQVFRWGDLLVSDDNNHETYQQPKDARKEMSRGIGLLEVLVYRVRERQIQKPKKSVLQEDIKEVHEKILKGQAITCSVELAEGENPGDPSTCHQVSLIDGIEHPIAIFRFKYRTKTDLQNEHIISRSPTPSPGPLSFEDLPENEIQELASIAHTQKCMTRRIRARITKVAYEEIPFEDLDEEEVRVLAKGQWEVMNGEAEPVNMLQQDPGPVVKKEDGVNARRGASLRKAVESAEMIVAARKKTAKGKEKECALEDKMTGKENGKGKEREESPELQIISHTSKDGKEKGKGKGKESESLDFILISDSELDSDSDSDSDSEPIPVSNPRKRLRHTHIQTQPPAPINFLHPRTSSPTSASTTPRPPPQTPPNNNPPFPHH